MAATTKLTVWNDALREIGQNPLANTVDANQTQLVLSGAFDHAVEYTLGRLDWNFACRRAVLAGVSDTTFPPYTLRYARPANYLRKCWLKQAPADEFQTDHTESGLFFYGFVAAPVLQFVSDEAANYDPANWPPHFTRCLALYLALLVAPKIGRTGDDQTAGALWQKLSGALSEAEQQEAVFATNRQIEPVRLPVMRRALEMIGQTLSGSTGVQAQADYLRWAMDRAWAHSVRSCLEAGAWNFASKRCYFKTGNAATENMPISESAGIEDGYSVIPDNPQAQTDITGFLYGFPLPSDFRHKLWFKDRAGDGYEARYQIMRDHIFTDRDFAVMEYVAEDEWTTLPTNWPATFLDAVAAHLAVSVSGDMTSTNSEGKSSKVTSSQIKQRLEANYERRIDEARNKDAIQQLPKRMPLGTYAASRLGGQRYGYRR